MEDEKRYADFDEIEEETIDTVEEEEEGIWPWIKSHAGPILGGIIGGAIGLLSVKTYNKGYRKGLGTQYDFTIRELNAYEKTGMLEWHHLHGDKVNFDSKSDHAKFIEEAEMVFPFKK